MDGSRGRDRHRPLVRRVLVDASLVLGVISTVALALAVTMFHVHFMRVVSPSMQPGIDVGDVVVLREQPTSALEEGQIIVLPVPDEGGVMYVHRLMGVRHDDGRTIVTTKGDANPAADPWELRIESSSVPQVVGRIPLPGVLAGMGGADATRFLLVLLVVVIAAPVVFRITRRMRVGSRLRALPVRSSDHQRR